VLVLSKVAAFLAPREELSNEMLWCADSGEPYAILLMEAIQQLLFKEGYTVRIREDHSESALGIDYDLLWAEGIGSIGPTFNKSTDTSFFGNRSMLLRLLLLLISRTLFLSPSECFSVLNPMLCFFTCKLARHCKNLVFSLLNLVLQYDCDGRLVPFASSYKSNSAGDTLVKQSLEMLIILIEYRAPSEESLHFLLENNNAVKQIYEHFLRTTPLKEEESEEDKRSRVLQQLQVNEYWRVFAAIQGKNNY